MISKKLATVLRKLQRPCTRCHGTGWYHEYNSIEQKTPVLLEKCNLCGGKKVWIRDETHPDLVGIEGKFNSIKYDRACTEYNKYSKCKII